MPAGAKSHIDEFMPEAEFDELHTVRVHATPARAWQAVREVRGSEIAAAATLMRIRRAAAGQFGAPRIPPNEPPMLDGLTSGRSSFTVLTIDEGREFVFCMVGRPWSNGPGMKVAGADELRAFAAPNAIKVVANPARRRPRRRLV